MNGQGEAGALLYLMGFQSADEEKLKLPVHSMSED